jgi:hypothetical protein
LEHCEEQYHQGSLPGTTTNVEPLQHFELQELHEGRARTAPPARRLVQELVRALELALVPVLAPVLALALALALPMTVLELRHTASNAQG